MRIRDLDKTKIIYLIIAIGCLGIVFFKDKEITMFIPIIILFLVIIFTKRMIEGYFWAIILAVQFKSESIIEGLVVSSSSVFGTINNPDFQWIIILTSCIAIITTYMDESGGIFAFRNFIGKITKKLKSSKLIVWIMSALLFIDDYMHYMILEKVMSKFEDNRLTKESISYIVKTTGVPFSVLVPISTWALFISKLIETNQIAPNGMTYYFGIVPFVFFAWISLIVSFLFALGIIPEFGKMKKNCGNIENRLMISEKSTKQKYGVIFFTLPILFLLILNLCLKIEGAEAAFITLVVIFFISIIFRKLIEIDFESVIVDSLKDMQQLVVVILLGYTFSAVLEDIGFMSYLSALLGGIAISPVFVPVFIFIILSCIEFFLAMGWGLLILVFPIIAQISLAFNIDAEILYGVAISASVFGSNACYYSDATVITSTFTEIDTVEHAQACMPYNILSWVLTCLAFLILGIYKY